MSVLAIRSRDHSYNVETCNSFAQALAQTRATHTHYLIDEVVARHYGPDLDRYVDRSRAVFLVASEETKSFEKLAPVFVDLIQSGLHRSGRLTVVGGGVLQDIGCFIASVLSRGLPWDFIPTTLLAQADSCIGSKSSINVGTFKNQIGTFHAPSHVWLVPKILQTLPFEEIKSGLGEIIKLQLLKRGSDFHELMDDLATLTPSTQTGTLAKWCLRSLAIKKTYIEADEFDRDVRNLLNYGHTFGHAYESVTSFRIPHGIAVLLGILTATFLSAERGLVAKKHYEDLRKKLTPWYHPYEKELVGADLAKILEAMIHDKKNTGDGIVCILTRGFGKMEKIKLSILDDLQPLVGRFLAYEAHL